MMVHVGCDLANHSNSISWWMYDRTTYEGQQLTALYGFVSMQD